MQVCTIGCTMGNQKQKGQNNNNKKTNYKNSKKEIIRCMFVHLVV